MPSQSQKQKKQPERLQEDEKLELEAAKTVSETVSKDTLVLTRTASTDDDGNVTYTSDIDAMLTSATKSIASNKETIDSNNKSIAEYYTKAGVDSTNAAQVDSTKRKDSC